MNSDQTSEHPAENVPSVPGNSESVVSIPNQGAGSAVPVSRPVGRPSMLAQLPLIVVTVLLSTGVAFALFSVLSRSLKNEVADQRERFRNEKHEIRKRLGKAETTTSKLLSESKDIQEEILKLKHEKKELRTVLEKTAEKLGAAQEGLVKITSQLSEVADDQGKRDAGQNAEITKVSNRVTYIERRVKSLEAMEADVMSLKNDTGNLKGQYATLKTDLKFVRDKGDVTQKELVDLGERSRLFQLRVLAARAREAAEAARQGDLKKLLARLSEEE